LPRCLPTGRRAGQPNTASHRSKASRRYRWRRLKRTPSAEQPPCSRFVQSGHATPPALGVWAKASAGEHAHDTQTRIRTRRRRGSNPAPAIAKSPARARLFVSGLACPSSRRSPGATHGASGRNNCLRQHALPRQI
jgi:hypothetical protein